MKILIIKLGALGDIIISSNIIKKILEHHENERVELLTTPTFEELFSQFENLKVTSFQRKGILSKLKCISWIRKQKFDRIYDLQSNDRTSFFCALSGSSCCIGNHPRYPYQKHPQTKYVGQCHSFDRLNQIIESVNIEPAEPLPYLPTTKNQQQKVKLWLTKNKLSNDTFSIMHAGSSPLHINKRWPHFEKLAHEIKKSLNIVWVGGNDDIDLNVSLSKIVGIDATKEFDIFELVELGKHAKFAVTNDSAPMHILSCSNIPVFGLFGPTYPRRTHALGQYDNVISANKVIAKNDGEFIPSDITRITTDMVLSKIKERNLI